jgi:hypothetical protein
MTSPTAIRATLALVATLLLSPTAQAQLFRAYLAPTGNDANPCTLQQPCRLLPAALGAVADGGEIWMLDSANYNSATVNIAKSVTIMGVPGIVGSVVATGGSAIYIATAGVSVALRNLVIVPLPGGGGTHGIEMINGAALTVENCLIANLANDGIIVGPGAIKVRVTDTTIRDNAATGLTFLAGVRGTVTRTTISGSFAGLIANGNAAGVTTTADIIDSTVASNGYGVSAGAFNATATVKVSVRGSLISRNTSSGLFAESPGGGSISFTASDNTVSNNANGISASGASVKVWASANTVSDNTFNGLSSTNAVFESAGDNAVRNNGTNKNGIITVIAME